MAIVDWQGVGSTYSDSLYQNLVTILRQDGIPKERGCSKNKHKNCACNNQHGASYSFGCSWSSYTHGACKFASHDFARGQPNKFGLRKGAEVAEKALEDQLNGLAEKARLSHF